MKNTNGQALVVLLFYVVIAITLVMTAVALTISNSFATMREEEGNHALELAENGIENALLRLLRDNTYSGETFVINDGTVTITATGSGVKTVRSTGVKGIFTKTVQVNASFTNGVLSVLSWQEM